MENDNKDSQQKIKELFDARAKALPDCNSVLDANDTEEVKFQNIFRDYYTKYLAVSNLKPNKKDRILDFGCGVGRLTEFLAKDAKEIIGTDLSPEMLSVARKNSKNQNVQYKTIDEFNEIEIGYFDKVFAFWVLGHIDNETLTAYINKFYKMLNDSGEMYIFEQTRPETVNLKDVLIQRAEEEYIELFQKCNFKLIKKKKIFRFPSYGMDFWKRIGLNNGLALKMAGLIEGWTVERKPEVAEYYTQLFVFRK